jgi:hypothetical protein
VAYPEIEPGEKCDNKSCNKNATARVMAYFPSSDPKFRVMVDSLACVEHVEDALRILIDTVESLQEGGYLGEGH